MSNTWKAVIGAAAALAVGFVVGLVVGRIGKSELEATLQKAKRRVTEAEEALKRDGEDCKQRIAAAQTNKHLLLAKEELLRATVELCSSNYGLTSQHLAQARSFLRSAQRGLRKEDAPKALAIFDRVGDAQTLAMRLDPMARIRIEQILADLQKLPGAR